MDLISKITIVIIILTSLVLFFKATTTKEMEEKFKNEPVKEYRKPIIDNLPPQPQVPRPPQEPLTPVMPAPDTEWVINN